MSIRAPHIDPYAPAAIRRRWDLLTAADIDSIHGDRERLIDTLVRVYGRSREVAEREVCEHCDSAVNPAKGEGAAPEQEDEQQNKPRSA